MTKNVSCKEIIGFHLSQTNTPTDTADVTPRSDDDLLVSLLGGGLLLVVLVLLGAGGSGQRALEDRKDLLVLDLLVRLELGKIRGGGSGKTGDAVLGNS